MFYDHLTLAQACAVLSSALTRASKQQSALPNTAYTGALIIRIDIHTEACRWQGEVTRQGGVEVASTRLCMVHLVVVEWCHKGEGLLRRMAEEAVAMVVHSMVVVVANMVEDNTYIYIYT
jgi:hypothetical protein